MSKVNSQEFLKFLAELNAFHSGLYQVLKEKFSSFSSKYQVVWQDYNTRLLKFSSNGKYDENKTSPILFIPSLINHGYILDIMPKYSLVRTLSKDFPCYLIDWGHPTVSEMDYGFEKYYTKKVAKILNFIYSKQKQKINLVGYCLGGVISILSTVLNADIINRLVLLACPWDFSCYRDKVLLWRDFADQMFKMQKFIPSNLIKDFFLSFIHIDKIYDKFIVFNSLASDDPKRKLFIRVEKWTMDNLFISSAIMKEIVNNFVLKNRLMNNNWIICRKRISLKAIDKKCFIVASKSDAVVPYISTKPLITQLSDNHTILSSSGHVGIIVSEKSKEWKHQLVNWLNSNTSPYIL